MGECVLEVKGEEFEKEEVNRLNVEVYWVWVKFKILGLF